MAKKNNNNNGGNNNGGGGGNGGGGQPKYTAPPVTSGDYETPPFMSYDPSIDAEIRANQRGIQDQMQDFATQKKIDRQDYRQSLHDIHQTSHRSRQDIRTEANRGERGFGEKRTDIRQTRQRGNEDFQTRMTGLFREYGIKASNQAQVANTRGVGEGGALAAAAAKRATNQGIEQTALTTAKQRQDEDIATALQRLGKDEGEFARDISRSKTRLGQDTQHDVKLTGRDFRRTRRSERRGLNRAKREYAASYLDLVQSSIYQARQMNPGAFSKYGERTGGNGGGNGKKKKKKGNN
jgi:hypothetical protein